MSKRMRQASGQCKVSASSVFALKIPGSNFSGIAVTGKSVRRLTGSKKVVIAVFESGCK